MTSQPQTESAKSPEKDNGATSQEEEKVLCPHCLRTATNGLKCKGICVSDNDY